MWMWLPCLMLSLTATLGGCGATISDGCTWTRPIVTDTADALTTPTKRQIVAHNTAWEENCR